MIEQILLISLFMMMAFLIMECYSINTAVAAVGTLVVAVADS